MTETAASRAQQRRRRRADDPGWFDVALWARQELGDVPHGEGSARLASVAGQVGRRPDTIRRFVAAATFIERLGNDDLAAALKILPVAAVELIARWWSYDPPRAREAALEFLKGFYPISSLREAERNARESSKTIPPGRAGHHALRWRLRDQITALVQPQSGPSFVLDAPGRYEPRKLDFLFRSETDPEDRIAVQIFGPFNDRELYWTREDDYLLNILGLSRVYRRVLGIVPSFEVEAEFESWLDHYNDPRITFHYLDMKSMTIHSPRPVHPESETPPSTRRPI